MKKPLLVLFDGNAIIHRAYHAFQSSKSPRQLTVSKTGELVSAVYGFTQMLLKTLNDIKPTHYAIAFDKKGPTFRHQLFDRYKAHRPPAPPELVGQIERVKQMVEAFRIPVFELEGYEADDLLGTLSHQASIKDIDTIIVTGDADTMQLVSPHIKVLYPKAGRSFSDTTLYDEPAVSDRYGVNPKQIADLKGLVGDPSDNIPGVPGIGVKTAVKLLQQFGTVEDIYDHIDEVTPTKLQETMRHHKESARQSKQLATIVTEAPVELNLNKCQIGQYDRDAINELFRELEFVSLRTRLPELGIETESHKAPLAEFKTGPPQGDYRIVCTPSDLDKMINRLVEAGSFAFDLETTSLNPMHAELVGLSFSPAPAEAYYVPVGHISLQSLAQLPRQQVIERLKPVLEDNKSAKLAHNGKYDMTVLAELGVTVNNLIFDTMVAAYLMGEKSLALKALTFSKLNIDMMPITDLIGTGTKQLPMSQVEIEKAADYACADADMTRRLTNFYGKELQGQGLWKLFSEVEMPLVPVLLRMERNGISLDRELLQDMSQQLGKQITGLEERIYTLVGREFNINSPQQLGKVLFDELEIPTTRRGKSRYSTEASVLEELKEYEIIGLIQEFRQLSKLKSTYIDALPSLINPRTGRVHTSFNQTRTTTGRLSSSEPNLQNIPVRGGMAQQIRRAFTAPKGSRLFAGDYSQIDLRALAHLSQDPGLVEAFQQDEDIHAATAAQLLNVKGSEVTADMRRLAKTVNFGIIYGMSEYGLEQATEFSREEAARFISAYFTKHPMVKEYLESTKKQARVKGYVQTILGRRRFIPEINSSNRQVREAAERMAINMPVQGTSADIIKVAMIHLDQEIEKGKAKSKLLLQVHDELVLEVPTEEMDMMHQLVPRVMSSALQLTVPLKVDTKQGQNWGEMF